MLKLHSALREQIAEDFRFASNMMQGAADLPTRLYFFSAFFGALNRALNLIWSPDLALVHLVLQGAHATIQGRLNTALIGGDAGVGWPNEFMPLFNRLAGEL